MSVRGQGSANSGLRTLRGVFEEPKMNHRRDFLRENKLNLRELQKMTTNKIHQQKLEQEKKHNKYLQKYQKTQEQNVEGRRRSASQSRSTIHRGDEAKANGLRQQASVQHTDDREIGGHDRKETMRRSYSLQRESRENLQPSSNQRQYFADGPADTGNYGNYEARNGQCMPRSCSQASVISKAESCDKEIQTEDINDEEFLYEALKKCSSSDINSNYNIRNDNASQVALQQRLDAENNRQSTQAASCDSISRPIQSYHHHKHSQIYEVDNTEYQYTPRSPAPITLHHLQKDYSSNSIIETDRNGFSLEQNMRNMNIDTNDLRVNHNDAQSSARSRQTDSTNISKKKSLGSVYQLGSRDEIRLPRYLEREKREKEEERVRELAKDPNCPFGHYALTEEERQQSLQIAQRKMDALIQELNHMPMTSETLRIRSRKVEIEKELLQIESNIRSLSKQKVYIAQQPFN